jgi:hypothetical protein
VKALIVRPDGTARVTNQMPATDTGDDFEQLTWLQRQVGGFIEPITPSDSWLNPWIAYCDEEGKLKHYPSNVRATELARMAGWYSPLDRLVGTVVFTGFGLVATGDDAGTGMSTDVPDDLLQVARDLELIE